MTENVALSKFACPACGGEAVWNPAKGKLVCPFCGTESAAKLDAAGEIAEHDLLGALRDAAPGTGGAHLAKRQVKCQSCNAISVLDPTRQAQNCEFCGSAQLVPYAEATPAHRPESVLPFKVSEPEARNRIRAWYGRLWLAPSALKKRALTDTVRGVYLPYWTFDARVDAQWTAEAGHYYYTTETYEQNGRTVMRQERRVRWEPASGQIEHTFDDEPVPGTHGVDLNLLREVEPFPTQDLVKYDTAFLSGHVVEHYQVVLFEAANASKDQMHAKLEQLCAAQIPGDTYRNLQIHPTYSNQTFKHILVPIWLLAYDYGRNKYQVVANGYTGVIAGRYPYSAWKIFFLVVAILLVVLLFVYAAGES